jgi:chemotaxis protein MotA
MSIIIGYVVVLCSVLGGYMLSGGVLHALYQPHEFLIIVGAAVGSFIVANSPKVIKASGKAVVSVFKSSNYSKKFHIELLSTFFDLTTKIRKDGILSIESDLDNYKESPLFKKYPLIVREDIIMEFICDHLRLIVTGRIDINHLESLMDEDIETLEAEMELPITAINKVSDSFPAFGIVAAVMGVVITMQSISGSAEVLGEHVAAALVGTFLGILIGYGFTSPIAAILETRMRALITILQSTKIALIASVHKMAPSIAVEFARKVLYASDRPTGRELEELLKKIKEGGSSDGAAP